MQTYNNKIFIAFQKVKFYFTNANKSNILIHNYIIIIYN